MNQMNKDSLLVAESYEKEHIKKYFTCCECPADYEMSVITIPLRSFSKDSTTFTRLSWASVKLVLPNYGIGSNSSSSYFTSYWRESNNSNYVVSNSVIFDRHKWSSHHPPRRLRWSTSLAFPGSPLPLTRCWINTIIPPSFTLRLNRLSL